MSKGENISPLRDFIYFDIDKATSILSQIEGGLITDFQSHSEEAEDSRNLRKYDLKFFKPEFGGIKINKNSIIESGILHHAVFNKLEELLKEKEVLINLNEQISLESLSLDKAHDILKEYFYVVAEGYAVFEDFSKIKFITERFNEVVDFIGKCSLLSIENSEEYKDLLKNIDEKRKEIDSIKGSKQRKDALRNLERMRRDIKEHIKGATGLEGLPDWLLLGTILFIDTFIINRINLRVYPFEENPPFHLISNMKRDCFVDADLENIMFAYGSMTNVKISILGLVTSLPEKDKEIFDPMKEYEYYGNDCDNYIELEKAFRRVFVSMTEFEKFGRFSHYPNVTIYPIAVYRNIIK